MKTLARIPLRATLTLMVLLLAACGPAPLESRGEAERTAVPQASPTDQPTQHATAIAVVDALGRTVQFAQLPQRIVVAGKSSLMLLDAMYLFPQAKERLVAYVAGKQKPGAFLGLVDPAFDQKQLLEVEAGPEQITPMKPDVVVLKSFMADKLGKSLEQLGIPVVYLDLETPNQYSRDLKALGQLMGDPARVEQIQAFYQKRLDAVSSALQGLTEGEKPRTLILQYTEKGGEAALNVPSASWMQTVEAELAGGSPLWTEAAQAGGWTVVNFEQIASWNPGKLFIVSYDSDPVQVIGKLKSDPKWQNLQAVKAGQIYGFAGDIYSWDQADPRWILGVTWLAGKLHPDRFRALDMTQEVTRFFGEMYGMDGSSIQQQILPALKGDIK